MAKAQKLDLYREHKAEYVKPKKPVLVNVGPALYLIIEGQGEPSGDAFTAAVGTLYGVAFTIKMTRKFAGKGDYKVCHLEGQYWCPKKYDCFADAPRDEWLWKLMIRVPDFIATADLTAAHQTLLKKGKGPEVGRVKLETIREGRCVQMLHVGPYADEPKTIALMAAFAEEERLVFDGRHHEIYLSDPRRVVPEKLKTILRHPVRKR